MTYGTNSQEKKLRIIPTLLWPNASYFLYKSQHMIDTLNWSMFMHHLIRLQRMQKPKQWVWSCQFRDANIGWGEAYLSTLSSISIFCSSNLSLSSCAAFAKSAINGSSGDAGSACWKQNSLWSAWQQQYTFSIKSDIESNKICPKGLHALRLEALEQEMQKIAWKFCSNPICILGALIVCVSI